MLSATSGEDANVAVKSEQNFFRRIVNSFKQKKIPTQVTLTYVLIMLSTLIISNLGTNAGIRYLFFHQAAKAIEISMNRMNREIEDGSNENILNMDAALSGVIIRITDAQGNLIADNSPFFPKTDRMLKYIKNDRPFFAHDEYELIETPHSFFYYKEISVESGGETFNVHLFKTITFEKELLTYLAWVNFLLDFLAVALAAVAGYLLVKKVLTPLRQVSETAREISAGNMNKRLDIDGAGNEVVELAESFNFMLDKINESFARQKQFVADVSHELRTPVTIIDGYAEILEKFGTRDKELFQESATAIKNESENMKALLESLLFLTRADQGEQPLNKVDADIEEILQDVIQSAESSRVKFLSDGAFMINGDITALKKMFAAILDNALKYSDDEVIVELKKFGDNATVNFIDKGIGISPEDTKKVFDRFFRADKVRTKSDADKSVGLGLSIAKWIADSHGIEIEIESELGKGTTFELRIKN